MKRAWTLRRKFGVLAMVYVLSLSANLLMSCWCIIVYFQSAFVDTESVLAHEQQIERVRTLLRRQRELITEERSAARSDERFIGFEKELAQELSGLEAMLAEGSRHDLWPPIQAKVDDWKTRTRISPQDTETYPARRMYAAAIPQTLAALDVSLMEAGNEWGLERRDNGLRVAATQERVMLILMVNTAVGAILCTVGLVFIRKWVLQPVAELREATKEIAAGNFDHRITPRSRDELGRLGSEVNHMASTIVEMQTKMIEQQRLAAAGEMVTRLAHNIRNPLAGIRGLAESTAQLHPSDEETVECQQRIIDTVDRFEKWLRELQQSVSPMDLDLQPVEIESIIRNVLTALRPMFDRHRVGVSVAVDPAMQQVRLDCFRFEQALVALVTNAVQASSSGQVVRIEVRPDADEPGRWELVVSDDGRGIEPELHKRIFEPYFTTKRDGNGIGLAMASKVVRIHGGKLSVESTPGSGTRFEADMPGMM